MLQFSSDGGQHRRHERVTGCGHRGEAVEPERGVGGDHAVVDHRAESRALPEDGRYGSEL